MGDTGWTALALAVILVPFVVLPLLEYRLIYAKSPSKKNRLRVVIINNFVMFAVTSALLVAKLPSSYTVPIIMGVFAHSVTWGIAASLLIKRFFNEPE